MATKTRSRSPIAVLIAVIAVGGLWISYSSYSRSLSNKEYDRERQVIVRWEVEMTRPANVLVITQSSIRGPSKKTETSASNTLGENIPLIKSEEFTIVISGELPVADRRGQITCRIYVNGKRVAQQQRIVRAGDSADGVKCDATTTG